MAKILIFKAFYLNDHEVLECLKSDENVEKSNFYHGKNSDSNLINKNCVSILNFIKINHFREETRIKNGNLGKNRENKKNKKINKIFKCTTQLTSLTVNNPDSYLIGLRTLLNKNKDIYLAYIDSKFSKNEAEFLHFLKDLTNKIEQKYQQFFEFNHNFSDLNEFIKKSINEFFNFINKMIKSKSKIPHKRTESNVDQDSLLSDSDMLIYGGKNSVKVYNKVNTLIQNIDISEPTFKLLMNKTFFIFTIIKVLKFKKLVQKNNDFDDNSLFDEILRLLHFYTSENPDNCMIILGSEFLFLLESINNDNSDKLIEFFFNCLKIIDKNSYHISNKDTLMNIIKKILKNIQVKFFL